MCTCMPVACAHFHPCTNVAVCCCKLHVCGCGFCVLWCGTGLGLTNIASHSGHSHLGCTAGHPEYVVCRAPSVPVYQSEIVVVTSFPCLPTDLWSPPSMGHQPSRPARPLILANGVETQALKASEEVKKRGEAVPHQHPFKNPQRWGNVCERIPGRKSPARRRISCPCAAVIHSTTQPRSNNRCLANLWTWCPTITMEKL